MLIFSKSTDISYEYYNTFYSIFQTHKKTVLVAHTGRSFHIGVAFFVSLYGAMEAIIREILPNFQKFSQKTRDNSSEMGKESTFNIKNTQTFRKSWAKWAVITVLLPILPDTLKQNTRNTGQIGHS